MGTTFKIFVLVLFTSIACMSTQSRTSFATNEESSTVLLTPWKGNYGGVPPWDQVKPEAFPAAFDSAIAQAKADIDNIAKDPAPPTFENTLEAMEKAGPALTRLVSVFGVFASNLNVGPMNEIEASENAKLTAYGDWIIQHPGLFARIEKVYQTAKNLKPEQKRLLENTYKSFVRQGAKLNAEQKKRLTEINSAISDLGTKFTQNVTKDEEDVTWVDKKEELAGISENLVGAFAEKAAALGKPGHWAIPNTRSAMEPVTTYGTNRALREKVWRAFAKRGDNGDEHDNNKIIAEIVKLRTERAKLLGYPTHAAVTLENRMAKNPENAMKLMMEVWPKAVKRVEEEVADMQALAKELGDNITIEAWDYRYYAEKVRIKKYALDSNEVSQYLQLEKLIDAIHWTAQQVFHLTFTRINDVPVFHPDVRVYKVTNHKGQLIGLWYLDPYARPGKRSGAWMTDYRAQQYMDKKWVTPIVSNNSNFIKPAEGAPVLISWEDAETLFHEFGHALHGLSSRVTYPSQAGTNVARDYVEFPSQLLEHWFSTDKVLTRFALHHKTGKPMSKELLEKIKKAAKFNQGFGTVEYLSAALVDMKLHQTTEEVDAAAFERDTLKDLHMPREIVMRHRLTQFLHLFTHGYDAAYYSYLWSDALTADAAELFEEQKEGYFDKKTAKSLIENIFSVGDTIDPAEGFRKFRGRDVDTKALLRKRGFPVNKK